MSSRLVWTDARKEQLRSLAAQQLKSTEIAPIMGLTRHAIEGACAKFDVTLRGNHRGNWTDEQDATLRERIAACVTARAIGDELGKSKAAVTCRAMRLGIKFINKPGWNRRTPQPKKREPAPVAYLCEPVTLLDLKANSCRYPIEGEGADTLFCGAAHDGPSSYCPGHAFKCFAADKPKSRDLIRATRKYAA